MPVVLPSSAFRGKGNVWAAIIEDHGRGRGNGRGKRRSKRRSKGRGKAKGLSQGLPSLVNGSEDNKSQARAKTKKMKYSQKTDSMDL